jgi:mannose/fructose/N-acetylgalactosamine-specific phosphotransferase system component IID
MRSVCIRVCSAMEAELAEKLLEENGIRAALIPHGESVVGTIGGGGRLMDLLVREEDAQSAVQVLGGAAPRRVRVEQPAQARSPETKQFYRKRIMRGVFWLILGIVMTVGMYRLAKTSGGTYVIWWGIMLWGLVDIATGLWGWLKH